MPEFCPTDSLSEKAKLGGMWEKLVQSTKSLSTLPVPVLEEKVERHCCTSTDLIRAGRR